MGEDFERTYVFLVVDYLPAALMTTKEEHLREEARVRRGLVLFSDAWKTRGKIDWTVLANHPFNLRQQDLTDALPA